MISLGGMVYAGSVRVGGDKFDEAIVNYIRRNYGMLIGETTAELDQEDDRLGVPRLRSEGDGSEGPQPRRRHPAQLHGVVERDPRGAHRSAEQHRVGGEERARAHAARARRRHRRARHGADRRRRAAARRRPAADGGNGPAGDRRRRSADLRRARLRQGAREHGKASHRSSHRDELHIGSDTGAIDALPRRMRTHPPRLLPSRPVPACSRLAFFAPALACRS